MNTTEYQRVCSVNDDSFIEVHNTFDKEGQLFIGIFEMQDNNPMKLREQSVWLNRQDVVDLHARLTKVLEGEE